MSYKSNACSFIHKCSHGGSFAKKKTLGFVFCLFFFFFLYRLQHGPGCSSCVGETSPSSFTCLLVVTQLLMLGRGWSELNQTPLLPLILSQARDRGSRTAKRMWEVWAKHHTFFMKWKKGRRDGGRWGSAGLGSRKGEGHLAGLPEDRELKRADGSSRLGVKALAA